MFGFSDLISLIISAFIILPVVTFLREFGYFVVSKLFGAENPRITIGTGPRLFKIGMFDIHKYYHLYSWYSYDSMRNNSNFAYVMVYSAPILTNVIVGLTINFLLANGYLDTYQSFWDRFTFYAFYYVLFDAVPMKSPDGQPNNGYIVYDMLKHGKRTDYRRNEPFIHSTTEVEEHYHEEMEELEEFEEELEEELQDVKEEKTEKRIEKNEKK